MTWFSNGCLNKPGSTGWAPCPPSDALWKARIANLSKHRANITALSPPMHVIRADGAFGNYERDEWRYDWVAPHLPQFQALGLKIVPLIALDAGMTSLERVLPKAASEAFFKAAVAKAVDMGYAGYNVDVEARGGASEGSWAYLKHFGQPWMDFLNRFADALHIHNMTLSVDIAGCCGWVDAKHPTAAAGHCSGAFAHHEFVDTTCPMYQASRLDTVFSMGTYSDSSWNSTSPYGPETLKEQAAAAAAAIGVPKYGLGFKGGWNADVFDETAKNTIRYLRDHIGVLQLAHWIDEPHNQATWDAWGFFLHDEGTVAQGQFVV